MGGVPLPTASTPGYALHKSGHVGCVCIIAWLELVERIGLERGLIRECLDVIQLVGAAKDSAGVHTLGSAADLVQRSPEWIAIYRQAGGAAFPREGGQWEGNEHCHLVIQCAHDSLTRYQFQAYQRGYNGLGQGYYQGQLLWGYGGLDTAWRPSTIPTTAQGIAWARQEADDMFTDADRAKLDRALDDEDGATLRRDLGAVRDQLRRDLAWQNQQHAKATAETRAQLAGLGAAIAQALAGEPIDLGAVQAAAQAGATAAIQDLIDHAETTTTLVVDNTPKETPA